MAAPLGARELVLPIVAGLAFAAIVVYIVERSAKTPCNCHDQEPAVDEQPAEALEPALPTLDEVLSMGPEGAYAFARGRYGQG